MTFRDLLQQALARNSNIQPQKIEVSGLLIPCWHEIDNQIFRFKIGTDTGEFFLRLNNPLVEMAKMASWDEVTITGYVDLETRVIEVDKLYFLNSNGTTPAHPVGLDSTLEVETYKKVFDRHGMLQQEPDHWAS